MEDTLKKLYLGEFTTCERDEVLYKRLAQYYLSPPDSVGNAKASKLYREFCLWASNNGYTKDDVSRAKMMVCGRPEIFVIPSQAEKDRV